MDLDGAREKRVVNYRLLEKIASRTSLVIDAGGGLRSDEDLATLFLNRVPIWLPVEVLQ